MSITYTTNYNLVKNDDGDIDWGDSANGNMDTIDAKLKELEDKLNLWSSSSSSFSSSSSSSTSA